MYKKALLTVLLVLLISVSCSASTELETPIKSTLKINENEKEGIEKEYAGYVTFWFDDGYTSAYDTVFPEFEPRGWKAVSAVLADRDYAKEIFYPRDILTWEELKKLEGAGWEISNHSMHHLHLNNYGSEDTLIFEEEIVDSAKLLRNLGFEINSFTFPYGEQGGPTGQKYVSDNHNYWRSSERGINEVPAWRHLLTYYPTADTSLEEMKGWVSEAENSKGWLILNLHDIDESPFDEWDQSTKQFEQIVKLVEESKLEVVTPKDMYSRFGYAEGKDVGLPIRTWNDNATIQIDKIDVNTKLEKADVKDRVGDFSKLEEYPTWISSTPWFGYPGLSAIAGHRQWGLDPKVFANLDKLEIGDKILVDNISYSVQQKLVVYPNDLYTTYDQLNEQFYEKNIAALMLITCTPYGTDLQRLLVVAQQEVSDDNLGVNSSS